MFTLKCSLIQAYFGGLGCLNSLYCLPKTFKPAPHKPWSGDKREKREGCEMYQDRAQKG